MAMPMMIAAIGSSGIPPVPTSHRRGDCLGIKVLQVGKFIPVLLTVWWQDIPMAMFLVGSAPALGHASRVVTVLRAIMVPISHAESSSKICLGLDLRLKFGES